MYYFVDKSLNEVNANHSWQGFLHIGYSLRYGMTDLLLGIVSFVRILSYVLDELSMPQYITYSSFRKHGNVYITTGLKYLEKWIRTPTKSPP